MSLEDSTTVWAIEERLEDAFVSFLKQDMPGDVAIYPGLAIEAAVLPAVVVWAPSSEEPHETAQTGHRMVNVQIRIVTASASEMDGSTELRKAREVHALLKGEVLSRVYASDVVANINGTNTPTLVVSGVWVEGLTRETDGERIVTVVNMRVLAHCQEET